jgi:dTDP-4-amino-4,6-dideoxygalactose transaminase
MPVTTSNGAHSYQSFCVFVEKRDEVIKKMRESGVETQIGTYSLHMHKAFNDNPNCRIIGEMKNSRYAFDHCLTLPMYNDMSEDDQQYVVECLIQALGHKQQV